MIAKTKKFLLTSLISLIILCIMVFAWVATAMSRKSNTAINEVGMIYMSEMGHQLQQKFEVIIGLYASQTEEIVRQVPPELHPYGDELLEELAQNASVRQFPYLGLYAADGKSETVYGNPVVPLDTKELLDCLSVSGKRVTNALDNNGERLLLLAVDAAYEMSGGKQSAALVAGIPIDTMKEAMLLDGTDSLMYSYIIRKDGSYVLDSGEAFRDNYFSRVRAIFDNAGGKGPEEYIHEIKDAIENDKSYSTIVSAEGSRRHLYCSALSGSDWYLICIMPYGTLDDAMDILNNQQIRTILLACAVLLLGVLAVFALYLRISQRQMDELDKAKSEADKANKAKSEFLSSMSHGIRTPLNGILGMTAIAMTNVNDPVKATDCLKKISMSGKHLLGLVNDVLDMSKIENGKMAINMEEMSLREAMEGIADMVQPQIQEKDQHFQISFQDIDAENVFCDSVRLNQILINLLSNAIKFTPKQGTVTVRMQQERSPKGNPYIRCHFWVKDSGIGMSKEFQEKIFDTFSREKTSQLYKTEGSGLGMAITKHIVTAMQGSIEVQSTQGQGSEFHVILDLKKAKMPEKERILPPGRFAGKRILLAEDNDLNWEIAEDILSNAGFAIDRADNGQACLTWFSQSDTGYYDLILMDIRMPIMNGYEAAKAIRSMKRADAGLPIIAMTADAFSEDIQRCMDCGMDEHISKPIDIWKLMALLEKYLI